jgi:hypothetical protein
MLRPLGGTLAQTRIHLDSRGSPMHRHHLSRSTSPVGMALALVLLGNLAGTHVAVAQSPLTPPSSPATASPSASPQPAPSPRTDPELESRLPATIGGQSLATDSRAGADALAGADPATIAPLLDAIAGQGRTIDDLSIAIAYTPDYQVAITAVRVTGADASALVGPVIAMAPPEDVVEQAPGQVAGKPVTVATDQTGVQQFYATQDILWIVRAAEPALTEIFTLLP